MSLTIEGVPASVSRADVLAAIETLGIDPSECAALRFDDQSIEVEVYSSERPDSRPAWRWTPDGKNAATHRLTIPIIDEPATP